MRLLHELADGPRQLGELRRQLGLDSGYCSRLLRSLEEDDLIAVSIDPNDRRQRQISLTNRGRREQRKADVGADGAAAELTKSLDEQQQRRLSEALATIDRLLLIGATETKRCPLTHRDAQEALTGYFGELNERFRNGFEPGLGGTDKDAVLMTPPNGVFLVMYSQNRVLGCGGVQRINQHTGEIKRMWIHQDIRGEGMGRRMLSELEDAASNLGYRRVVLDTNATLKEAIGLYESNGYQRIERYNDNPYAQRWFGKNLGKRPQKAT
jgi:DNA-binding MarR family transcriptional regulator/GNAT superfamily N-acetyltransferase